jgi:formate dehydrogenase subunit beta
MAATIIQVKEGDLTGTLNGFFRSLLEKGVVDALILPQAVFSGENYAHTVVAGPEKIGQAAPFLPVMMVNGGKVVASMTAWDPGMKVGAVLRSCEIRALHELTKFKQANLDRVTVIGVDCLGTMGSSAFKEALEEGDFDIGGYLAKLLSGDDSAIRKACRACPYPAPVKADMTLGFIGLDPGKELFFEAPDDVLETLGLTSTEEPAGRKGEVERIASERKAKKEELLTELKSRFGSVSDLLQEFARCKRCYNCRTECPICYCKECVFLTATFEHTPEQYLNWARRKGAVKMPNETLLFHLTRLNHMVFSCVECGLCSSACPNDLPVYELFQYVGKDVQGLFDYEPGADAETPPPVLTFKEDELEPR